MLGMDLHFTYESQSLNGETHFIVKKNEFAAKVTFIEKKDQTNTSFKLFVKLVF